ncbi:putative GST-like protein YibF [Zhongshania aliphaticivorans]|uniref:Putative GST-like protein YibF n=1 Tax=Zhongshania aliphaticivorans TaxID=1470434 RepID=A0A5S9MTB6_9GAMM|nr:glutathione S-transferase family protein [Zhongshania aliphaticivorans]CAA0080507.1 putative GST-like protein YibF [Zhongshania aliphaticivorans]CAA0085636.1 putative GST-like protein YibF [Zhongshania aliphaticivorans]
MIVLHGNSVSPYVRKVLVALAIKQLEFEQIQQMPYSGDPEFFKISPLGKIPALQDGDLNLCDSSVICEYLEDNYPDIPTYPTDAKTKAKARWIEELAGSKVTELASGIFFQRFMRPMFLNQETDEALVDKIINKQLPPILDYIESVLPKKGFLFGSLTIADISIVSPFINAGYANYQVDAARWPVFTAFMERVKQHDIVAPLLLKEAAILGL